MLFLTPDAFAQTVVPFTASGTWNCPAGVSTITVEAYGPGGGSGRGGGATKDGAGGGGGGGYAKATVSVTPGPYTITIGTGGAGGTATPALNGQSGTSTTATFNGVTLTATSGNGGFNFANGATGGSGGTGSVTGGGTGILTYTGGSGATGAAGAYGGGGGGCAGINGNGFTATTSTGGNGNGANAGKGGDGQTGNSGPGFAGANYGGGAGGGTRNQNGIAGTNGYLVITYGYCAIGTTSNSYWISNFSTTGGTANITNATNYSAGGYGNYTAQTVNQYPGNAFNFSVATSSGTHGINIWVDWNNDDDFDDAGEKVYASGAYVSSATGTITIPGGTSIGAHRMRVVANWSNTDPSSCGTNTYTEAEDYTVQVIAPPACSGTPVAGTVSTSPTSASPGSAYTVSATGFTIATGLTYQWQYSTNGGSTWTNAGAASGSYANYSATAPAVGTTVLWHLVVTCTASGQSATSTNGTFNSVNTLNVPTTGNNTNPCGTNVVLYDNGGSSSNYANSSSGYTVLEAGLGGIININGNYNTESSIDYVRIYNGTGTGGTLLASYSGTGTINYTGTAGQTLTVQFYSDSSVTNVGFTLSVTYSGTCYPACAGTPTAGTVSTNPTIGPAGSSYTVTATGYTQALNVTYQWQYSTNGGSTWTNAGAATGTYSNYTATAPAVGTTVLWHLVVTCTTSAQSATSTNGSFTSVNSLNVPASGNNSNACGTNVVLYDNGGNAGDYSNNANGYTVLQAAAFATINISGSYNTESIDDINIYAGTGTGGALLATYSGTGTINYTGTAGQTLTVQFTSDGSVVYSGFSLNVTYSGACAFSPCAGTPTGGTVTVNPNSTWPGNPYTVSATGYSQALNLTYQWQYSTDGGTTWTNAGASSGTYSNYTATAPASGVVLWHLLVTCTNSGITSASSNGTFTTMEVSNIATGCPNVVSGGLGLNGADPAALSCATGSCVDLEATYLDLGSTTSYIVEPIAYNPPRAFNGLANPVSVNTDDKWSPIVPLPFNFCFYGNTYTNCLIGSNGILTFDTVNNSPGGFCDWSMYGSTAANLPVSGHDALIENSIFGVFHDIIPTNAGQVGWELITLPTGCRALVVSWYNVPMYLNDAANDYTGMMVLYENSNVIEVYVQKKRITTYNSGHPEGMWNDGNAVIGIQNATGTMATVPPGRNALDPNWTTTNEAWRFVPNGTSISTVEWFEGPTASGPVIGTTPTLSVCPTATTTYTARVTYTLCDGRTIYEDDQTTVTVAANKTWNGSAGTNWNTAANWTPAGVPVATEGVLIPNTVNKPIISGGVTAVACSLNIQNGGILTVNPANTITVTNAVSIAAGGDMIIENTGSLVQINNVANSGTAHIKRTSQPMYLLDYTYWNSPVTAASGFTVGNLTSGTNKIYRYTPTVANGSGTWAQIGAATVMNPTFGVIARAPGTFPTTGPKQTHTVNFTGTPNNGPITMPIAMGTNANLNSTVPSGGSTVVTDADDEWNLIGNPYPSAINIVSFLNNPANIPVVDGTVYLWTHNTLPTTAEPDPFYGNYVYNYTVNDYATVNSFGATVTATTGGTMPTHFIGTGQSFFISAETNGNVTFDNSMRVVNNNANFYRNTNETNNVNGFQSQRLWLNLSNNNGGFSQILVGYAEGATLAWDRGFDGEALAGNAVKFYSLGADKKLTIQARPWPFVQEDIVPLGFKATAQGSYTIGIDHFDASFNNSNVYLEDKSLNLIHDLKSTPYSFTSTVGTFDNRFVLRYTESTLSNEDISVIENSVVIYANDKLRVNSTLEPIKEVVVYDVLGRLLVDGKKINANQFTATTLNPTNSTLIVKVTLENNIVITKKVIY